MYTQEISIEINNPVDYDEVNDKMCDFAGCVVTNGQRQWYLNASYFDGNRFVWVVSTLEKNSLAPKYDNFYVKKYRKELEKLCGSKLKVRLLGENPYHASKICTCKKPSCYVLFTDYCSDGSPISCGDCDGFVPLYKLPGIPDPLGRPTHYDALKWQILYKACDELQMACGFAERWGMKQMQDADSGLSQEGRELCRKLEELTCVPVYYYLYNYRRISRKRDCERPCPDCGGDWLLEERWHTLYDFCCEKCRLVSNISFEVR